MIEVRTFEGDASELSAFVGKIWTDRYRDKMAIGLWPPQFMDWELFGSSISGGRDLLVAAYDGGKLIGVMPGRPMQFQCRGRGKRFAGSLGSFLSVDPAYEKQGVSLKLLLETRRRHRDRGLCVNAGYLIKDHSAMGKEFWLRMQKMHVVGKAPFWARMLDHRAVAAFLFSARDRWGTRVLGWFQGRPRQPRNPAGIRDYRPTDLADCLRLANRLGESAEFGTVWDEPALSRQLDFQGFPKTIVAEHEGGGRVAGFINYFHQTYLGRSEMSGGVIDLLSVDELPPARRMDLLSTALCRMADAGLKIVLALRVPVQPSRLLFKAGFVPQPTEQHFVLQSMLPDAPVVETRNYFAIWR